MARLERATTLEELHKTSSAFARSLDFTHFLYAVRIPKPPGPAIHFVISGYPKEWRHIYEAREYLRIDPIVQHAFNSAMPIVWDEVPRQSPEVRAFFDEAADHGLIHGVSSPVYGRRGEIGLFSIARANVIPLDEGTRLTLKREVQWITTGLNEAVLRTPSNAKNQSLQRLTTRERECLMWASEGMKSSEIAAKMSITERTVLAHFETAGQKLGVSGRHNIIARAISLGELELPKAALTAARPLPKPQEFAVASRRHH